MSGAFQVQYLVFIVPVLVIWALLVLAIARLVRGSRTKGHTTPGDRQT